MSPSCALALAACLAPLGCAVQTPFRDPVRYPVGRAAAFAVAADVDGDGKQDLLIARSASRGELSIWHGEGNGAFRPGATYIGSSAPRGVSPADVNSDGKVDLVVSDFYEGGYVTIFLNAGDGRFLPPTNWPAGRAPSSAKVTDINGDGRLDILVVNSRPDDFGNTWLQHGNVSLLLGGGDGTFQAPRTFAAGVEPRGLTTGDWNGDGKVDLAIADDGTAGAAARRRVRLLLGRGDGTFSEGEGYGTRFGARGVSAADVNHDGRADLIVRHSGVSIFISRGDGTFEHRGDFVTGPSEYVVPVDIDGDGKLDLAAARVVLLGDGDGNFPSTLRFDPVNDDSGVTAADFDGDGRPDLAILDRSHNRVSIYLNGSGPSKKAAKELALR